MGRASHARASKRVATVVHKLLSWVKEQQQKRGGLSSVASLFGELQRRNVFRVAIAYVVVGWVVLQVAGVPGTVHLIQTR
jgi:hypothetical protein